MDATDFDHRLELHVLIACRPRQKDMKEMDTRHDKRVALPLLAFKCVDDPFADGVTCVIDDGDSEDF